MRFFALILSLGALVHHSTEPKIKESYSKNSLLISAGPGTYLVNKEVRLGNDLLLCAVVEEAWTTKLIFSATAPTSFNYYYNSFKCHFDLVQGEKKNYKQLPMRKINDSEMFYTTMAGTKNHRNIVQLGINRGQLVTLEYDKINLNERFCIVISGNESSSSSECIGKVSWFDLKGALSEQALSSFESPLDIKPKQSLSARLVKVGMDRDQSSFQIRSIENDDIINGGGSYVLAVGHSKLYPTSYATRFENGATITDLKFPLVSMNQPLQLSYRSKNGEEIILFDYDLEKGKNAFDTYHQGYKEAFQALNSVEACDLFVAGARLNDPDGRIPAALAQRNEFRLTYLTSKGLTTRTGFKQGKIGERYTPDIKYYTSSSDSFTVNNQNYTVTKGDTNYSSGWKEGIEGYTAIWGVKNASTTPYVVEVAVIGTSSYNPMVKDSAMWSASESRKRVTQRNSIRLLKRIFLMPGMDFKDQMVVGEEQPSDFKVEVQDFWPVDSAWASNFEKAMGTDLRNRGIAKTIRPLLEKLKEDPIATAPNAWASDIASRLATANRVIHEADLLDMRRDLDLSISTGSDFDPDFFNEVSAVVHNRSAYRYEVTLKKPDGNTEMLVVEPRSSATGKAKVQRIAKSDLRAEIMDIVAPSDRVFVDSPESTTKPTGVIPAAPPVKKHAAKKK